MVIVSAFGFLFPISYRHSKIWQKLKFEITFDFTEKNFFDFVIYLYYGKKWLINSYMIRPICCRLYRYICIMYVFFYLSDSRVNTAICEETDRQMEIYDSLTYNGQYIFATASILLRLCFRIRVGFQFAKRSVIIYITLLSTLWYHSFVITYKKIPSIKDFYDMKL